MSSTKDSPDHVDIYVGRQVRAHREAASLTQSDLGRSIGVTFQQVQKYERGVNRISASTLSRIADTFNTMETAFFPVRDPRCAPEVSHPNIRGFGELAKLYATMPLTRQRLVIKLVRELSADPEPPL